MRHAPYNARKMVSTTGNVPKRMAIASVIPKKETRQTNSLVMML